jgi:hypothetical protein
MKEAFYVTMVDGVVGSPSARVAWLAGPFASKEEAEGYVKPATDAAIAINGWYHFHKFGVTKLGRALDALDGRPFFSGKLNQQLGIAA